MRKFFFFILLFAGTLQAADTLYVVRFKPDHTDYPRAVNKIFLPGYSVTPSAGGKKLNIQGTAIVWNITAAQKDTVYNARMWGVDTTEQSIVYTTVDTVPNGCEFPSHILNAQGYFEPR